MINQGSNGTNGGGGIGTSSSNAIIVSNTIYNNTTHNGYNNTLGYGGGINSSTLLGSPARISKINNNIIYNNNASWGGGISLVSSDADVYSNKVYSNSASEYGGGIYIDDASSPMIYNDLIDHNTATSSGGGLYIEDGTSTQIINCTIADNSPDGANILETGQDVLLYNTIAWYNYNGVDILYGSFPADPNHGQYGNCDINNFGSTVGSNIHIDPKFVDHSNRDYKISSKLASPCLDAGDNTKEQSGLTLTDIRGSGYVRKVSCYAAGPALIDMGAFEYEHTGDCDLNPRSGATYKIAINDSSSIEQKSVDFVIYPNPANQGFSILFNSETEELVNVCLLNSIGSIIIDNQWNLNKGENYFYLERNQLPAGLYYIKINSGINDLKTMKVIFN